MSKIDKNVAMNYLMGNEKIFNMIRKSFISSYSDCQRDYLLLIELKDYQKMYSYIHSVKGITLNLGAVELYDASCQALEALKKELWNLELINKFFKALEEVVNELKAL